MELRAENLTFEYEPGTTFAVKAVKGISVTIPGGQFVGIVGHTGSGKTTFMQLLDGLLTPTDGTVYLDEDDIFEKGYNRRLMRDKVGIVFQYPEYQLFETTVLKDVSFGPKNKNLSGQDVEKAAREALAKVGITEEEVYNSSPFELSGGQRRRVAIAGVIAMQPKILILDEPTAGLDPEGRKEILDMLSGLHKGGMTILLVSHSMEDVAEYAQRILVMDKGEILMDAGPKEVFAKAEALEEIGLAAPEVVYLMKDLKERGLDVDTSATTVSEAVKEIKAKLC